MNQVRLFSHDDHSEITLEIASWNINPNLDSVQLKISVTDGKFHGSVTAWVGLNEVKVFLEELRRCEQSRLGTATLNGLSPGEFSLVLESSDMLGHFRARYEIAENRFDGQNCSLYGLFNLANDYFLVFVDELIRLFE